MPSRLDGTGAVAAALARELLEAADGALGPLHGAHAAELAALEDDAKAMGERGVPGRKGVEERHQREERRWRTEELRTGLGVLARAYRDRLVDSLAAGIPGEGAPGVLRRPEEAREAEAAVSLVVGAAAALRRNAQETLLLDALLVRLGRLG
ncbi:MAG: hypothetical protein ACRDWE_10000 [Acidimicrobiales bacterium]